MVSPKDVLSVMVSGVALLLNRLPAATGKHQYE